MLVRYLFKAKRSKAVRSAFRELLADPVAWRDSSEGWQCAERDVRLDSWEKARRMVFARRPAEKMPKREKVPPQRRFKQLDTPGLELVEAGDEDYADGYEWHALVTDLDMDARDVLPLYRERGDCENIFDEMKNQWGWSDFTAHSLKQTALFAGMAVIAANLWNVFTRLGDDGMHHEAATSRPLLQSCVARLSRHARQGIVTIYTATCEKARAVCRAISAFLSKVASASLGPLRPLRGSFRSGNLIACGDRRMLSLEERRQRIIAHAFREYGTIRRMFPPDIGGQMTMPLA